MANFALSSGGRFPEGTSVGAYPASRWPVDLPSGAPIGAASESQAISSGVATFTTLSAGDYFFAAEVNSEWRYVRGSVGEDLGPEGEEAAGTAAALAAHEADTTSVHGIVNAALLAEDADVAAVTAASTVITANTQTDDYTLVLGDAGKCVEINSASAEVVTVPPNASVAFPTGTVVELHRYGAGTVTVAPGAAVTIRSNGGLLALAAQYSSASLRKRATNEWVLSGDIAA